MGGWNWIDKTGMRWGKLVAVKYLGNKKWLCHCDCGNDTIVDSDHLKMDRSKRSVESCGCGRMSRLTQNHDYFSNIDTEVKAYIVGFLASDGTIESNKEKSSYTIKIVVNRKDRKLLEDIKEDIKTSANVKDFSAKTKLPQGGYCESDFSSLSMHNKKMVEDLESIGVTSNKSLTLNIDYSKIPDDLKRHFWRGWIDGDGSFGIYGKRKILSLTVTSSLAMCESTKNEILKIFPDMKIHIYQAIKCNEYTKRFIITSQNDVFKFLEYIYSDSNIYLERKYNNFLKIKEEYKNN